MILMTRQRLTTVFGIFLTVILMLIHVRLREYAFDDAYIHFRVARNLVESGVPYYNVHDALKVSTSSGWVVFLAAVYWGAKIISVNENFPLLVSILNALIVVCVLVVYPKIVELFLSKHLSPPQKLLLQIIVLAFVLPSSIGLMETPLALLIAGLGLYLLLCAEPLGFALLGIAIYLRLELIILVALVSILVVFQHQFKLSSMFGYFLLGFLPFVLFDWYYFSTPVPHSIIAKSKVYSIQPFTTLADIFAQSLPGSSITHAWFLTGRVVLWGEIIIMLCWATYREIDILKESGYPAVLYFSGCLVMGGYIWRGALLFDWYIPLYALPIVLALFSYAYVLKHPRNIILKLLLFFLALLSVISILFTGYAAFYRPVAVTLFRSNARVKVYLALGKTIRDTYPDATLLTSEIGGLGYAFPGVIFDAAGLASPDALSFHPMKVPEERSSGKLGAIPPGYVKLISPDIIVSYDVFAESLLRDDIVEQYNIVTLPAYLPDDAMYAKDKLMWNSKYLRILIRKTLPVSDEICALSVASETSDDVCGPQ